MSEGSIVDWGLAGRIGGTLSGAAEDPAHLLGEDRIRTISGEALERALAYTRLNPVSEVPEVELVSRRAWICLNLAELRELAAPMEARAAAELRLPWPVAPVARAALGAAGGAEAGAVMGYSSRRVLGQYQVSLGPNVKPPRMLLVGANLAGAAEALDVDEDAFLLWVAIHEQTHSLQFASVPWLRHHIAGLIARLIESAAGGVDLGALVAAARRLVSSDPRKALGKAMRGELTRALAGPEQSAIFDEMQAVMAVVEGYAEHVMDAASADDDGLALMRERMNERRARRGGLADMIARVLGMGMKLRQYELGKAWCDAVVTESGIEGLNRVWSGSEALPSLPELEDPAAWLRRVAAVSPLRT